VPTNVPTLAQLIDSRTREGELWEALPEGRLRCYACGHRCVIPPGQRGICKVRYNEDGRLRVPWGYVAGTRIGKSYVSFHLMSVYTDPELMASMSAGLRRRMQGKSCFNFTKVDEPLFAELEKVTAKGIARHPEMVAAALAASPRRR